VWQEILDTLNSPQTVEYGAYQRNATPDTPIWRRPTRGKRFKSLFAALFAKDGARSECLGRARYARNRYSQNQKLAMPYVAAWVRGSNYALLVRQSTPDPEVTVVESSSVDRIDSQTEEELTIFLSALFGRGAEEFGVRLLESNKIVSLP